jgi:ThiF family
VSRQLIDRSPSLAKLRAAAYDIQVHPSNHLLVHSVPYVTAERAVAYGTLIAPLTIESGGVASIGPDHRAYFKGGHPHDHNGSFLKNIANSTMQYDLGSGLVADHMFSAKPADTGVYADLYELVETYVDTISKYAKRFQDVDARTGRVFDLDDEDSVFEYTDSASSRAGIGAVTDKLRHQTIAIIGLGGTGSYILDLVAKTPVKEIRLYDRDVFSQHNAFRSPGAAPKEVVERLPQLRKVHYLASIYSKMHKHIKPFEYNIETIGEDFADVDFVFICIDVASAKGPIIKGLTDLDKLFIDVGMGVDLEGTSLGGMLRTTFSANEKRAHERNGIPLEDAPDDYDLNIQIADLNALNAALAVIRWKKHRGFYASEPDVEYSSLYTTDWNQLDNTDRLNA